MELFGRDFTSYIFKRYYAGKTTSKYSTFTFDLDYPFHCVDVNAGCWNTMLHAGNDVTSEVRWYFV